MTINDILNSDLSDSQKIAMIKILQEDQTPSCRQGGELETKKEVFEEQSKEESLIIPTATVIIGEKKYKVAIANTEEEKYIGLSQTTSLKEDEGMLFVYDEPQEDLWYTCEDMSFDIDVIFLDEEGIVTSVHSVKAGDSAPIEDTADNAQFVLEVNYNSGIQVGSEADIELEESDKDFDEELTDEDKETLSKSKMLILDEQGNVQFKLEGGERIFSRIKTKQFIKAALKAYRTDDDLDYRRVGRIVFKELEAQDSREPEYTQTPK